MKNNPAALSISLERARAHWYQRQGLGGAGSGALEDIVAQSGWVRTLGGADVYLAVRARAPGMRANELENAIGERRLQVIPAVRGCIYLVPRPFAALALKIAEEQSQKRNERDYTQLGISKKELEDTGAAIVSALKQHGPLSTDALRKKLPEGVVRSFGDKGKAVGISSSLPPALRALEFSGQIERSFENRKLDNERYLWSVPAKNLFDEYKIPGGAVDRYVQIAQEFFKHAGPASLDDFTEWTSFTKRDAKAAVVKAGLVPISVEGYADEAFVIPKDVELLKQKAEPAGNVHLLSFEDNYIVLHGGPRVLSDERHHHLQVHVWGRAQGATLGTVKHIATRLVFYGNRLIGFWEYDLDREKVIWTGLESVSNKQKDAISAVAHDVGTFLKEQVGHARSYSLDNEEAIRKRAALVKAVQKFS